MVVTVPPAESVPGGAELLWPGDPRIALAEADAGRWGRGRAVAGWPVTAAEICGIAGLSRDSVAGTKVTDGGALLDFCREAAARPPLSATLAFGAFPLRPLGATRTSFETFDPGWQSYRVDPELARAWTELSPLASLELRHAFTPTVYASFRMGLRRDIAAWLDDDLGLNAPGSTPEVDLNEPSFGYLSYAGDWLELALGRLPVHWGPSPEFSLAVSGAVPYHNGALAVLKAPRLRYRFLVSSLNPWLEGTPRGGASSEDFPEGSEEWRQRNYPVLPGSENAHRRVYDARAKTLVAHRLETWFGRLTLGATETQAIGGKVPDLRDANPFAVFHNDFHQGYANNGVAVDALARLPWGLSLAGEIFMDDLEWPETEGEGTSASLLGYLAALRQTFRARGWAVSHSLHAVYTDPFLYGFLQPLNSHASRHVLNSNFLGPGSPVVVDKYVVDYPLGYLRGGDALDFWYRLDATPARGPRLAFVAGLLAKGEVGLATPYEEYFRPHGSSPSGRPERELRLALEASRAFRRGLLVTAGAQWHRVTDEGHVAGRDRDRFAAGLSVAWTLPAAAALP